MYTNLISIVVYH